MSKTTISIIISIAIIIGIALFFNSRQTQNRNMIIMQKAQESALNNEISAIDAQISALDTDIADIIQSIDDKPIDPTL